MHRKDVNNEFMHTFNQGEAEYFERKKIERMKNRTSHSCREGASTGCGQKQNVRINESISVLMIYS